MIEEAVSVAANIHAPSSLYSRLLHDHMGIITRMQDGSLCGKGSYTVFYSPVVEWSGAAPNQMLGEWIYGEWSDRQIDKEADFGKVVSGSRVVLAQGKAVKSGNGTVIQMSCMGLGLVQSIGDVDRAVHFIGAVVMSGQNTVVSHMPEREFYSAITGFITSRGDRATPLIYPLKSGGRR